MNPPTLARTGDRDAHQWCLRVVGAAQPRLQRVERVGVDHEVEDVALLADEVGLDDPRGAEPGDRGQR